MEKQGGGGDWTGCLINGEKVDVATRKTRGFAKTRFAANHFRASVCLRRERVLHTLRHFLHQSEQVDYIQKKAFGRCKNMSLMTY